MASVAAVLFDVQVNNFFMSSDAAQDKTFESTKPTPMTISRRISRFRRWVPVPGITHSFRQTLVAVVTLLVNSQGSSLEIAFATGGTFMVSFL